MRMDESTFWVALEFRICREFAGLPERHRRYWWCDGFVPEKYLLDASEPKIEGRAWICNGPKQALWWFTLFLERAYDSRQDIPWANYLPPDGLTRWIAIDEPGKLIQIEPSAAVPDSLPFK